MSMDPKYCVKEAPTLSSSSKCTLCRQKILTVSNMAQLHRTWIASHLRNRPPSIFASLPYDQPYTSCCHYLCSRSYACNCYLQWILPETSWICAVCTIPRQPSLLDKFHLRWPTCLLCQSPLSPWLVALYAPICCIGSRTHLAWCWSARNHQSMRSCFRSYL